MEPEPPRAAFFLLEPEPTQVGWSWSQSWLRDLGHQEPEPPKKVAAPQLLHMVVQHPILTFFIFSVAERRGPYLHLPVTYLRRQTRGHSLEPLHQRYFIITDYEKTLYLDLLLAK